ncbi:hypothetical protein GGI08_009530, partial [Coemansia sp. S2]
DLNRLDEDTTPSAGAVYRRLWDDTLFSEAWWKCNGHANDQTYPFGTSNKKLDFIFLSGWLAEGIQQCSKSLRASLINEDHAQLWTEIVGYIPPGGPAYTAAKGAPKLAVKQASKAAREAFQHEIEKVLGIIETDDQLTDLTNLLPSHVGGNQATRADASVIEEGEGLEDTIYQIAAKHFPLATTLRKRSILFLKTRQLTTLHTHIGRVAAKWPQRPHVLIKLVEKATKLLGPSIPTHELATLKQLASDARRRTRVEIKPLTNKLIKRIAQEAQTQARYEKERHIRKLIMRRQDSFATKQGA